MQDKIKIYLDEISDKLWQGNAAVMVGAGFSKNASNEFPSWNDLGDIFYKKLYGRLPTEKDHYINVLKLADEIEAIFKRPVLDKILLSNIPDNKFEPSYLHRSLLELPWKDIFTPNYDTLLERTCKDIFSRKFSIVINQEDLIYSSHPRIIKLNGSFTSERPFIITEEDFRKYPKDFALFVNTVQQALLENILCLIGFSGDDPNFLRWIGWIRDNLGESNLPQIYLIGIIDISEAKRKLLEEKYKINIVDISLCDGIEKNHKKAFELFFKYLKSKEDISNNLNWSKNSVLNFYDPDIKSINNIIELIKEWKKLRTSYPNWVIMPSEIRKTFWLYTETWINFKIFLLPEFKETIDIEFIYELNWRLEKCLCPIYNNIIEYYENIIEKYNPFPDDLEIGNAKFLQGKNDFQELSWEEIQQKWLDLNLSLMRFYREEGFIDKWNNINNRFRKIIKYLPSIIIQNLYYEQCLCALFNLNIKDLISIVKKWKPDKNFPFIESKRAMILAELGNLDEAEKIIEDSLSNIRLQLNNNPVKNNYSLISQESYIMLFLQYIKNGKSWIERNFDTTKIKEISSKFNERWNDLKQYKCDPWNELDFFKIVLEREYIEIKDDIKFKFDIGEITKTHHFKSIDKEVLIAYNFLKCFAELGIPYRIPGATFYQDVVHGAINRMSKYSPFWALSTLIRTGESKLVDSMFSRESLDKINTEILDSQIKYFLRVFYDLKADNEIESDKNKLNYSHILYGILPEILSRLCAKCSDESISKLIEFIIDIYNSKYKIYFSGIPSLVKRFINSLSIKNIYYKIPDFLKISIITNINESRDFPEPFSFIKISKEDFEKFDKINIEKEIIENLLFTADSKVNEERKRSIYRLAILHDLELLDIEQKDKFGLALWNQVDNFQLPKNTNFFNFYLITLPCPKNINPIQLFKNYIKKQNFLIQDEKNITIITNGIDPLFNDIIYSSKQEYNQERIEWTQEEILDILNKIIKWWDADKENLKNNKESLFGNYNDEFKRRFANINLILIYSIFPGLSLEINDNIKKELQRLLVEMKNYGIPYLSSYVESIPFFPDKKENIYQEIENSILSLNDVVVVEAYNSVIQLISLYKGKLIKEIPFFILNIIIEQIKWRRMPTLIHSLNIIIQIVKNVPELLQDSQVNEILIGLEYLKNETKLDSELSLIDKNRRLVCRKESASLAHSLYIYYQNKKVNIPDVINDWKNICLSKEEFSEIRNQWGN